MQIRLVKPDVGLAAAFWEGFAELESKADRDSWIYISRFFSPESAHVDFVSYVQMLLALENNPPPPFVNDTVYWAFIEGKMVGRIAIRHRLNEFLLQIGGHVGYIVRPSFRRKGIASEMLKQMLATPRARSIGKILLTCDEANIASRKTIEKNSGVLENITQPAPDGPRKARYWITL